MLLRSARTISVIHTAFHDLPCAMARNAHDLNQVLCWIPKVAVPIGRAQIAALVVHRRFQIARVMNQTGFLETCQLAEHVADSRQRVTIVIRCCRCRRRRLGGFPCCGLVRLLLGFGFRMFWCAVKTGPVSALYVPKSRYFMIGLSVSNLFR